MIAFTIVVPDNIVIIGGKAHPVDCSSLAGKQVIVWDGVSAGHVEFASIGFSKEPPEAFADPAPYQWWVDAWTSIENQPPPPVTISTAASAAIVKQSYAACLHRKADVLHKKGDAYDAVKMLLKASNL